MTPAEAAALQAIRREYEAPIVYTGAGLTGETLNAIRSDVLPPPYQGFGGRTDQLSFEIDDSLLPERPRKGDTIVDASGAVWSVIDTNHMPPVAAWVLSVEVAP